MIINLIVHGNPKGDRCPQIKSLFVESCILQARKEMYFHLLVSFLKDLIMSPLLTGGERCLKLRSDNWVQNELKVRWLSSSSSEESYFEVLFPLS
ncbi:hypothetical protein I79_001561 [Cricetulus griseus]|uniref:Uncharacterized protein n=1 Tax=Cricetulus griseus TaxID=10029 RepID=G3GV31_CRIGR|nr:hypothetical protein I79_001561 [Cricetulus griseus]